MLISLGRWFPLTMRHFWCVRPVMAPLRRLPPLGRRSRRQCSRLCTVTSRFWHDQRSTSTGHTSSSSSSFSSSSSSPSSSSYYFFFIIIIIITLIIIIFFFLRHHHHHPHRHHIFSSSSSSSLSISSSSSPSSSSPLQVVPGQARSGSFKHESLWLIEPKKHVPIGCGRAPRALQEQSFDIGHFISCHLISYLHASSFLFWISSS